MSSTAPSGPTTKGRGRQFTGVAKAPPVFAQVANQLIAGIEAGEWGLGDRLPGEQELARQFGVSRPSIREALSCLQFSGYIEPRQGSGTVVVSQVRTGAGAPIAGASPATASGLLDIFEARFLLEPAVVAMAAEDPDPGPLRSLRQVLTGMELSLSEPGVGARSDLAVHIAVVQVCRNKTLVDSVVSLLRLGDSPLVRAVRSRAWDNEELPREWLHHHERISRAVTSRDPVLARAVSTAHLVSVVADMTHTVKLTAAERRRAARLMDRHDDGQNHSLA